MHSWLRNDKAWPAEASPTGPSQEPDPERDPPIESEHRDIATGPCETEEVAD